jgi:hypothetical protein
MSNMEVESSNNKNKALAEYGGISILDEEEPGQTIIQAENSEYERPNERAGISETPNG